MVSKGAVRNLSTIAVTSDGCGKDCCSVDTYGCSKLLVSFIRVRVLESLASYWFNPVILFAATN